MPNIARMALMLPLLILLSACGSARLLTVDDRVNISVGNMEDISLRYARLSERIKSGEEVNREVALVALGIADENKATIEELRRQDIQAYLFGGATIMGDSTIVELLDHMRGLRIPFTKRQEHIVLANAVYINTFESGYDIAIILIFKDGKIRNVDQIGVRNIDRSTKRIIWNPSVPDPAPNGHPLR